MIPLLGEMSAKQTKGCLNSENLPPPLIYIEPRGGGKPPPYHINTNTNPDLCIYLILSPRGETKKTRFRVSFCLEATPGFEPGIRVLQTHALPLGYVAVFCFVSLVKKRTLKKVLLSVLWSG